MNTPLKRIVITPVFNESKVLLSVLERVKRHVDILIVSDDGSTDGSKDSVHSWMKDQAGIYLISAASNRGTSTALKKGYILILELLKAKIIGPDDLVMEIDSDGQHDPDDVPRLFDRWEELGQVDVVLACRDFSNYPLHKVVGNRGLTVIASALSGHRYTDVESNFRVMPASVFEELLGYYCGYKYSAAFEVGVILPRLGYRVDNSFVVRVPFYRSGSRIRDGFHVVWMGCMAWWNTMLRRKYRDLEQWSTEVRVELVNKLPVRVIAVQSRERPKRVPRIRRPAADAPAGRYSRDLPGVTED